MTSNNSGRDKQIFILFIAAHLILWTLVPSLTNHNLPIDVIEGLAWGNEGQWGYHKHPALSPWLMDIFARLSGSADWAQYLLSQLSVCIAFIGMWLLARDYLTPIKALISVLLLEGVYYHGYSSPEFNANVILLPLWSIAIYAFYKAVENQRLVWWVLLGAAAALGLLGKYFTGFLLIAMFGYLVLTKKGRAQFLTFGPYAALASLVLLLLPHLNWMIETDFSTLNYGVTRAAGKDIIGLQHHIIYPVKFFASQIILLIPLLIMLATFGFKRDPSAHMDGNKTLLNFVAFGPPLLILILSAIMGWKLRSMWGTPLFLMSGLLLVYYIKPLIDPQNLTRFKAAFLFFALIGPIAYIAVYGVRPLTKDGGKRSQFPGQEITEIASAEWRKRYPGKPLNYVIGDVWRAGNVAYNLAKTDLPPFSLSKRTASVFIDGKQELSPWINPSLVTQSGALVFWKVKTNSPKEDPRYKAFKTQFPAMIHMDAMHVSWDSWFSDKGLQMHWAILPPKE